MAGEIEITISEADLGRAEPEFGISRDDLKLFDNAGAIRVSVFVDGEPAELTKTARSIIVKAPPRFDGLPSTVVVTANDGKILNVLEYLGDEKIPVEDLADGESDLIKVIDDAVNRIVAAITSQKGAGRPPRP